MEAHPLTSHVRQMLELVASHLRAQGVADHTARGPFSPQRRTWVDIGGGTGWNIEQMARISPDLFASFDAIYL